jgi:hypothetical protein
METFTDPEMVAGLTAAADSQVPPAGVVAEATVKATPEVPPTLND